MAGISVQDVLVRLRADLSQYQAQFQRAGEVTQKFGMVVAGVGGAVGSMLTAALGAAAKSSTKLAVDFNDGMNKVVGLVGISRAQVDAWRDDVRGMAVDTGRSTKEMVEGLYYVTSAFGGRGKQMLETLEMSAKAAAAGLGTVEQVADGATSAINAYGDANLSAQAAVGVMVATVREGKMASDELSSAIGRILPLSAQMGISFQEVGASIAGMSRLGLSVDQSVTSLRSILSTLIKPGRQTRKALEEIGLSAQQLRDQLRQGNLIEVLISLAKAFDKDEEAMARMFPNIRAMTGVLNLAGKNAENVRGIFARMREETGQSLTAAFKSIQGPAQEMRRALQQLKVTGEAFGQTVMQSLVPVFQVMRVALEKAQVAWESMGAGTRKTMLVLGALVGPIMASLGGVIALIGVGIAKFTVFIGLLIKAAAAMKAMVASLVAYNAAQAAMAAKLGTIAALKLSLLNLTSAMGLFSKSIAVVAVAFAAWKVGRWIDDLTGLGRALDQAYQASDQLGQQTGQLRANPELMGQYAATIEAALKKMGYASGSAMGDQLWKSLDEALRSPEKMAALYNKVMRIWNAQLKAKGDIAGPPIDLFSGATEEGKDALDQQVAAQQRIVALLGHQLQKADKLKGRYDDIIASYQAQAEKLADLLAKSGKLDEAESQRAETANTVSDALADSAEARLAFERQAQQVEMERLSAIGATREELDATVQSYRTVSQELASVLRQQGKSGEAVSLIRETEEQVSSAVNGLKDRQAEVNREYQDSVQFLKEAYLASEEVTNGQERLRDLTEQTLAAARAWAGVLEDVRSQTIDALTTSLVDGLTGGDMRDAWKAWAEGLASMAQEKLSAVLQAMMIKDEGERKKALQATGLVSQGGKVNTMGVIGMLGGLVSAYGQQKQDQKAAAIGGAMSGAAAGAALGVVGAVVGAILGGIAGYFSAKGAEEIKVAIYLQMRSKEFWAKMEEKNTAAIAALTGFQDEMNSIDPGDWTARKVPREIRLLLKDFGDIDFSDFEAVRQGVEDAIQSLSDQLKTGAGGLGDFWAYMTASGPTAEEESVLMREMRDRARKVWLGVRSVLDDLGADLSTWPDIVADWHVEVSDFGGWWKNFLAHELPGAIFKAMRPSLEAALLASQDFGAKAAGRIAQEMDAVLKAEDFDKAFEQWKKWYSAVKDLNAAVAELTTTTGGMREKLGKSAQAQWAEGAKETNDQVAKLMKNLNLLTSTEQVERAEKIVELARQQAEANERAFAALEQLRTDIVSSAAADLEGEQWQGAQAQGPVASLEFAAGKFRQAMDKMAKAATPEELQQGYSDLVKWRTELKNVRKALEDQAAALQELQDSLATLEQDLATPFERVLADLSLTGAEAWAAGVAETQKKVEEIQTRAGMDTIQRVSQIRDLVRQQYQENIAYLQTVVAAQKAVAQAFEAYRQGRAEKAAEKEGPRAQATYYQERMQALYEALRTATDPGVIQELVTQITAFAGKLYELTESVKEGDYSGFIDPLREGFEILADPVDEWTDLLNDQAVATDGFSEALNRIKTATDPESLKGGIDALLEWESALVEVREEIRKQIAGLDELAASVADLAQEVGTPVEELVRRMGRTGAEVFAESLADTTAKIAELSVGLDGLAPPELAQRIGQIRDLVAQQYEENLRYLETVVAAQQSITSSFEAFWRGREEKAVAGKPPAEQAAYYRGEMEALYAELGKTTDPTRIQALVTQIQDYAGRLLDLGLQVSVGDASAFLDPLRQALEGAFAPPDELTALRQATEKASSGFAAALAKVRSAANPQELQDASTQLADFAGQLASLRDEYQAQYDALVQEQAAIEDLAGKVGRPISEMVADLSRTQSEEFSRGMASTMDRVRSFSKELASGLVPADLPSKIGQIRELVAQQYEENLAYLEAVVTAQETVRSSFEGFWAGIEEEEARKAGPVALGQYYVDEMLALQETLKQTTDPAKVAELVQQIQAFGQRLYDLGNTEEAQDWKVGVETGPGQKVSILDWLKQWMPDVQKMADAKIGPQYDAVASAQKTLAAALAALGTTAGTSAADLKTAIDAINLQISTGLGDAIDAAQNKVRDWEAAITLANGATEEAQGWVEEFLGQVEDLATGQLDVEVGKVKKANEDLVAQLEALGIAIGTRRDQLQESLDEINRKLHEGMATAIETATAKLDDFRSAFDDLGDLPAWVDAFVADAEKLANARLGLQADAARLAIESLQKDIEGLGKAVGGEQDSIRTAIEELTTLIDEGFATSVSHAITSIDAWQKEIVDSGNALAVAIKDKGGIIDALTSVCGGLVGTGGSSGMSGATDEATSSLVAFRQRVDEAADALADLSGTAPTRTSSGAVSTTPVEAGIISRTISTISTYNVRGVRIGVGGVG